jgi:hypothetical protein
MFYHGKMLQIGTPHDIRTSAVPEVQHFITGGREGAVSTRSDAAIQHGRAPGMLSQRTAEAIDAAADESAATAEQVYVLLEERPDDGTPAPAAAPSATPELKPEAELEPTQEHRNHEEKP